MPEENTKPVVIYVKESLIQSVLSDLFSYGMLFVTFGANHLFIGSKILAGILLIIFMLLTWSRANNKLQRFYSIEDFKKFVDKL